jgi:hypothetical protein
MELRPRTRARASLCVVAIAAALGGCSSKGKTTSSDPWPVDTAPFADAASPASYVPRVKNLLTGFPATDAEVQAVTANPAALKGLIDGWMQLPQFRARMLDFFRNAFQQNNITVDAVSSSLSIPDFYVRWEDRNRLAYGMMDVFPLTAWQLVQEGRPFHETITTRRYWLSTAQLALLSYSDMFSVNDAGDRTDRLTTYTNQNVVLDPVAAHTDGTPLTAAESVAALGRGKPGAWTWRVPVTGFTAACQQEIQDQRTQGNPDYLRIVPRDWDQTASMFELAFANVNFDADTLVSGTQCATDRNAGINVPGGLIEDEDWTDSRWVMLEQLPLSEEDALPSPQLWDLAALRTATTLKLKSPRLGFFGTLAWNGNWPTNESNQARVTANQSLIVAIGQSIIPAAAVAPAPVTASDAAHSTDPACAACHKVLDPLRQFFRQSYTFSYHEQLDLGQYLGNAAFLLDGMNQTGVGVQSLAGILAGHPHYAIAWAQKLQFWANSNAASEDDPDLQRIAAVFAGSGYDFRVLVREVFSSPLVTLSRGTLTYRQQGVTIGIARRDQLCATFGARLGLDDVCHLRASDAAWNAMNQNSQLIPTDLYYRAAELPALARNPDLFFRDSVEAMCGTLAGQVVSNGTTTLYSSSTAATAAAAITDMVARVMGLPPSDPRSPRAAQILTDHFTYVQTATASGGPGANRNTALQSTFTLACISPTSVLVGL